MQKNITSMSVGWILLWGLLVLGGTWQSVNAAPWSGPSSRQTSDDSGSISGLRRVVQGLAGNYLEPIPDNTTTFETGVSYQGLGRTVRYIKPRQGNNGAGAPAIILLHFGHGTPDRMANLTHIARLVSKTGVWVILPSAVRRHWQESPLRRPANDDVGYLDAVIQDAIDRHPIDPERVYMAGLSNGGFMTNRFLCAHPQRVAAAAIVGASLRTLRRRQCSAGDRAPVPMLIIDGTDDPIVPYDGRYGLESVPETFDYWLQRDGCDTAAIIDSRLPNTANDATRVAQRDNTACEAGTGVRLLTVTGGGHAWPGGETHLIGARLGRTSQDISATDQLWRFFQQYGQP